MRGERTTSYQWPGLQHEPRPTDPLALIVSPDSEFANRVRDAFEKRHFRVVSTLTALDALREAGGSSPDIVVIDAEADEAGALELCGRVRTRPGFERHTPILMTRVHKLTREDRLRALQSGVWEVIPDPLDLEEAVLKAANFVQSHVAAPSPGAEQLLDYHTQLYSEPALARRAEELSALAARQRTPFGCIVLGPEGEDVEAALARCATVLRADIRRSDVAGILSGTEFAVVAVVGELGAIQFARRLRDAILQLPPREGGWGAPLRIRAGYCWTENAAYSPISGLDLLARARRARAQAVAGSGDAWVQPCSEAPARATKGILAGGLFTPRSSGEHGKQD